MSVAIEAFRELMIGTQMYAQPVTKRIPKVKYPKWSEFKEDKYTTKLIAALGVFGAIGIGVFSFALSHSDDQTASEMAGVEEEARMRVVGFSSVESAVHGSDVPFFTSPDLATIILEDGTSCKVEFRHDEYGPIGIPMGAEVTDWRDCPLVEQN